MDVMDAMGVMEKKPDFLSIQSIMSISSIFFSFFRKSEEIIWRKGVKVVH